MWVKIVNGDLQDSTRPDLFEYVVDFLSFCTKLDLVWRHADWALQKDQKVCTSTSLKWTILDERELYRLPTEYSKGGCLCLLNRLQIGVQIFTKRPTSEEKIGQLNPDDVITYLQKHSQALLLYLEHLVLEKRLQVRAPLPVHYCVFSPGLYLYPILCVLCLRQKEKYHTHLAVLYADKVLGLISRSSANEEQLSAARQKLQRLLKESNLYRVQLLLGRYLVPACLCLFSNRLMKTFDSLIAV